MTREVAGSKPRLVCGCVLKLVGLAGFCVLKYETLSLLICTGSTGFIQGTLSKIQGLLKAILQFSRTKSLGKILIQVLKFFFKNARLR